jgi:hypothetical protein
MQADINPPKSVAEITSTKKPRIKKSFLFFKNKMNV